MDWSKRTLLVSKVLMFLPFRFSRLVSSWRCTLREGAVRSFPQDFAFFPGSAAPRCLPRPRTFRVNTPNLSK